MNKSLWQKVQPHAIAIGIFFIISCIYCLPALQGMIVAQPDSEGWKGMAQQSIEFKEKFGHYPLWTNSMFSGMPTFQILVGSTFDIKIAYLHHLFILFLPEPAGLFFLACLGFYILCMSLGIKSRIAILGSLAYAFASYNAVIVTVGHTTKFSSMGYAPALLAGLILLSQRKYLLGFITVLVFSTQLFYQGHIQIVYYTLLTALCIGIAYAIHAIREGAFKHLGITMGLAFSGVMMGMLSYAVILFPTYDYTKETMRGGRSELIKPGESVSNKSKGGLDKDYAFGYSYGISEVLTVVVPRLFGGSSGELQAGSKTAEVLAERTGMTEEQSEEYSRQFPAYWGPQGGTAGAVYFGAIICALFIFGIVFYNGWHKQWIIAATILGILLAWGKNFSAFNYFLFDHLPFYNKFRAPSMAMVIPQLTFPLLAALGLNQLFDTGWDKKILWKKFRLALTVTAGLAALMTILYFTLDYKGEMDNTLRDNLTNGMSQQLSQQGKPAAEVQSQAADFGRSVVNALKDDRRSLYGSDLIRSLIFIALAMGLMYFFVKDKIKAPVVIYGLIALTFIDLIGVDLRYLSSKNYVEKEEFHDIFNPTAADMDIKRDTSYFRVFNQEGDPFQHSAATARTSYLHNSIGGYHPAKLALYQDIIANQLVKGNLRVFDMLNTKYFISNDPSTKQSVARQNPGALGPVWFISGINTVNNADEEMKALDNFNPRDTAIMDKREQSKIPFQPQRDSSAAISLVQYNNDRMSYSSSAATDQFAVFSEIYYPNGWKAYIDGKETPIVKVNYLLRGLPVPKGNHKIEMIFAPAAYVLGDRITLIIGILSILILSYGLFVLYRNYKNPKPFIASKA